MLKRVWKLKEEIIIAFEKNKRYGRRLLPQNTGYRMGVWFYIYYRYHAKNDWKHQTLNLESKESFAHNICLDVKEFQIKLALFSKQTSNENLAHSPLLKKSMC